MRNTIPGIKSYAWFGRVFEVNRQAKPEPSSVVKAKVAEHTFSFLRLKEQGPFKLAKEDFESVKMNSWGVYDVDLSKHFNELTDLLATDVVNPESRVRHNVEKQLRKLCVSLKVEDFENAPIDKFVTEWASLIEQFSLFLQGNVPMQLNSVTQDSVREMLGLNSAEEKNQSSNGGDTHWVNRFFRWIHA